MDFYDLTRIFGALCATLLLYLSLTYLLEAVFEGHPLESPAYAVAVEDTGGEAAVEEVEAVPVAELLAAADAGRGEKLFKRCAACHQAENATKHGVGPALWGVVGRDIASFSDFTYSGALQEKSGAWDWDALNAFLTKPKKWVPGTKMNFAGLKKPTDRASLLLWLNERSDAPLPLPQ